MPSVRILLTLVLEETPFSVLELSCLLEGLTNRLSGGGLLLIILSEPTLLSVLTRSIPLPSPAMKLLFTTSLPCTSYVRNRLLNSIYFL